MACGCKAKQNVTYVDPLNNKVQTATVPVSIESKQLPAQSTVEASQQQLKREPQQELPSSYRTYAQIASSLDVSSTTAPDQLCFNCVRKHLGMAYMFGSHRDTKRVWAALAQLMCVVTHLKDTHPNLAYMVRDKVLLAIRGKQIAILKRTIRELINQFQTDPQKDLPQYFPLPSIPEEQQLLTILLVNALLFVQLTYQEVNKTWATAQLSYFSYNSFRTQSSLESYNTYRPLWKLIQSMQPMDQNYLAARDYIYSLMLSKFPYYAQHVLPQYRQKFQQDYKKQKELMEHSNTSDSSSQALPQHSQQ